MISFDELQARIHRSIPVTRALPFRFLDYQPGCLTVTAPLAEHMNDKGTFFAGSQAALFTLSGWALATIEAEHAHGAADVLAVDNELKYTAPLTGDMVIRVAAGEAALEQFHQRLERRGRARIGLEATGLTTGDEPVSSWSGHYLARLIRES